MTAIYAIPTSRSQSHYSQTTTLGGRSYLLRFDWTQRLGLWVLSIYDSGGSLLLGGKAVVKGVNLLAHVHHDDRLPVGVLMVIDKGQADPGEEPGLGNLSPDSSFVLWYAE